ncbi:MAG: helix-hairpin-helix domain-containing protein [Bacteroidota bacterium]
MFAYPRPQRIALLFLIGTVVFLALVGNKLPTDTVHDLTATAATTLRTKETVRTTREERPAPEAFAFDPNVVTAAELQRLGLSERQASGWLKFRGNRTDAFRRPEDIGKLYVLSEEDKARLIPLAYVPERASGKKRPAENFTFDPNTVSGTDLRRLGLSQKQAAAWLKFRGNRQRAFRAPEDIRKLFVLNNADKDRLVGLAVIAPPPKRERPEIKPGERFRFDPNRISPDSLSLLGFPEWQAQAFARYRGERTNTFRRATDLRRVGALDSTLVEAVLDLIDIRVSAEASPTASPTTYAFRPKASLPPTGSVDINLADTTLLKSLPGIGAYRAKRILRFRRALGGFVSVAQVADTRGLPDSTFQRIREYLLFATPPRQIAINRATYEELNRHPYVNRNLANSIVRNREKAGRFSGPEDLRRLRLITDELYEKLLPYFSFE